MRLSNAKSICVILILLMGLGNFLERDYHTCYYLSGNNDISLDILGYHNAYNQQYRHEIQRIERMQKGAIIQVGKQEETVDDMGRFRKKHMRLSEESKKSTMVIVNRRAWDIEKITQRVITNHSDGDARFVLGGYYILKERYSEAAAILQGPESAKYSVFNHYNMYEYLGYTYYQLGRTAKLEKKSYDFFNYIGKEQQAYIDGFAYEPKNVTVKLFKYHYALTFIDLGIYLEHIGGQASYTDIHLPRAIDVKNAREAYNCALKVLLSFKRPDNAVYEKRAFVYKKLGIQDKAVQERKKQGASVKTTIYAQQRTPIRKEIFDDLESRNLLSAYLKDKYEKGLSLKYSLMDKKAQKYLDSCVIVWSKDATRNALERHAKARVLPSENKLILRNEIYDYIKKQLSEALHVIEVEFLWNSIQELIAAKNYKSTQRLIERHGHIISSSHRGGEFIPVKEKVATAVREIRLKEDEEARKREDARKKEEVRKRELAQKAAKKKTVAMAPTKISPKAEESNTSQTPAKKNKKSVVDKNTTTSVSPMAKQVGLLIDNLIAKRDYVGAYRGLIAYEKILKANFSSAEIERSKKELERFIRNEYSDKYLKKLKKELSK